MKFLANSVKRAVWWIGLLTCLAVACVPTGEVATATGPKSTMPSPPETDGVLVRVLKNSNLIFDEVEVRFPQQTEQYGRVAQVAMPDSVSDYRQVSQAYRYAAVTVTTGGKGYTLQPIDYVGESFLGPGHYTYVLNLIDEQLSLTLVDEDKNLDAALVGKAWRLTSISVNGKAVLLPSAADLITIQFAAEPLDEDRTGFQYHGFTGCNSIGGTYVIGEGRIALLLGVAQTEQECPQGMDLEELLIVALELPLHYKISEEQLTLDTGTGTVLNLAAGPLAEELKNDAGAGPVVTSLQTAGAVVEASPNLTWMNPFNDLFEEEIADLWDLQVNGETIHVYVFGTGEIAQTAAEIIGPTGDQFTLTRDDGTTVEMLREYEVGTPPRYWQQNQFIIYYSGKDEPTLDLLDATFGERIADATRPYQPDCPGQGRAGGTLAGITFQYNPCLFSDIQVEHFPSEDNATQLRLVMASLNLHASAFTPMIVVARERLEIREFVPGIPGPADSENKSFQNGSGQSWTGQAENGEWVYVAAGLTDDGAHYVLFFYPIPESKDGFTPDLGLLNAVFISLRVEPE